MYLYKQSYVNATRFVFFEKDNTYLSYNNRVVALDNNNFNIVWISSPFRNVFSFIVYSEIIYVSDYYDNKSHNIYIDKSTGGIVNKKYDLAFFSQEKLNCVLFNQIDEVKQEYIGLFNLDQNVITWQKVISTGGYYLYENNFSIFTNRSHREIKVLDNQDGSLVWELDIVLSGIYEKGEIIQLLGIYQTILLVAIKGGKLIGIDIQTGKVEWLLQESITEQSESQHSVQLVQYLQLHSLKPCLYALKNHIFQKVTLSPHVKADPVFLQEKLKDKEGHTLSVRAATLKGDYFYFTAEREGFGFGSGLVGAFHIESMEIVWLYDMHFPQGVFFAGGEGPKVDEKRLYVIDSEATLYIFEREQ
ncbi:PQQ-binding-like beta-propeller repeat protein [Cytophagaceae bacterium DM2B3-1]|uniref:PQQ-binding-like beta-propeller repeat protein n=1 Tax=Xanthocytophaga flava TaxID=3048013 RepID=A0ABT7CYV8_9BACT|nr:PQQ-binding-like beta-propeller repeat protein [Xanthocytophaga flavus]MDJ1470977.1 PQQ-binding-like beta-propeller repeat protein [Xanthocytophaga flavus]MDJ1498963.1 PQQ-binding-like beta-propeller repeat protein [Xanthocytophaga flavus]